MLCFCLFVSFFTSCVAFQHKFALGIEVKTTLTGVDTHKWLGEDKICTEMQRLEDDLSQPRTKRQIIAGALAAGALAGLVVSEISSVFHHKTGHHYSQSVALTKADLQPLIHSLDASLQEMSKVVHHNNAVMQKQLTLLFQNQLEDELVSLIDGVHSPRFLPLRAVEHAIKAFLDGKSDQVDISRMARDFMDESHIGSINTTCYRGVVRGRLHSKVVVSVQLYGSVKPRDNSDKPTIACFDGQCCLTEFDSAHFLPLLTGNASCAIPLSKRGVFLWDRSGALCAWGGTLSLETDGKHIPFLAVPACYRFRSADRVYFDGLLVFFESKFVEHSVFHLEANSSLFREWMSVNLTDEFSRLHMTQLSEDSGPFNWWEWMLIGFGGVACLVAIVALFKWWPRLMEILSPAVVAPPVEKKVSFARRYSIASDSGSDHDSVDVEAAEN